MVITKDYLAQGTRMLVICMVKEIVLSLSIMFRGCRARISTVA